VHSGGRTDLWLTTGWPGRAVIAWAPYKELLLIENKAGFK
jgi:hypothetical protein